DSLQCWHDRINADEPDYKLIQAFAETYHETLYDRATFDAFWGTRPFHLQTVVFGATELYSGVAFRLQYADLPPLVKDEQGTLLESYRMGNGNVYFDHGQARQLRLAEIVAASSCFPFGFEPLVLPDDFTGAGPIVFQSNRRGGDPKPITRVALQDGGIYDNQGIEAIVLANQRNRDFLRYNQPPPPPAHAPAGSQRPTTLLLISDVASAGVNLYEATAPGPRRGKRPTLGGLFGWVCLVLAVVALGAIGVELLFEGRGSFIPGLLVGLVLPFGVLVTALGLGVNRGLKRLRGMGFSDNVLGSLVSALRRLSLRQLLYLLDVRIGSLATLVSTVFLRRVRSLNYGLVYESNAVRFPVVSSILGNLVDQPGTTLPEALIKMIEEARAMPTTLWWGKDKPRMDALIASGEITLCYQLLRKLGEEPRMKNAPEAPALEAKLSMILSLYGEFGNQFRLHPSMKQALDNGDRNEMRAIAVRQKLTAGQGPAQKG
ncbi:MAG: hypothetical protein ICV83_23070, partial [Cytophagales bacterium]|nr:hypothetical protein [Cytophagales bacterium]